MGLSPAESKWERIEGGYRCEKNYCVITDKLLAEGTGACLQLSKEDPYNIANGFLYYPTPVIARPMLWNYYHDPWSLYMDDYMDDLFWYRSRHYRRPLIVGISKEIVKHGSSTGQSKHR
jgi:hypothetical protein